MIKLDKEDIKTCKFGLNFSIEAPGVSVVFSPEAVEEFFNDIQNIKAEEAKTSQLPPPQGRGLAQLN